MQCLDCMPILQPILKILYLDFNSMVRVVRFASIFVICVYHFKLTSAALPDIVVVCIQMPEQVKQESCKALLMLFKVVSS